MAGPALYPEGPRSWLADQLIEPTRLVFAVVVAESLSEYRHVFVSPFHDGRYIASLALLGVYLTAVWSWFGWHTAHVKYPYRTSRGSVEGRYETLRVYADLAIVIAYAWALFQVGPVVKHPHHDLMWLLVAYPAVLLLYGIETGLRRKAYPAVSRLVPVTIAFGLFVGLVVSYVDIREGIGTKPSRSHDLLWLNGVTLGACIVLMAAYRFSLNVWWKNRPARKRPLTIGIDLDGVLADQISGVLPRIRRRLGIELTEDQISEFRLPLGPTDLAAEIEAAQRDDDYVLSMPARPKSKEVVDDLRRRYRVFLITARPPGILGVTMKWLKAHRFRFDDVINACEQSKSVYATDVLVDDYTDNIGEFLAAGDGLGILVDRPWNRTDRAQLDAWLETGRLQIASSLDDIPDLVGAFSALQSSNVHG